MNNWPWCNDSATPCCSGVEWLAKKVAERYTAAYVTPPADVVCNLTWAEWSALVRNAASHYDVVGKMPTGTPESLYECLTGPWYRWESVLKVSQVIAHYDYGIGQQIGAWAVPQFVNCYPLVNWRLSSGQATLSRLLATVEARVERPPLNTYISCHYEEDAIRLDSTTSFSIDTYVPGIRWFLAGNPAFASFPADRAPTPTTAPVIAPVTQIPAHVVVPMGEILPPFVPVDITTPPRVASSPILASTDGKPASPLPDTPWIDPVGTAATPREPPPPSPGLYSSKDRETYINGALVPYIGPAYYDVTDWLRGSGNHFQGSPGSLIPGLYTKKNVNSNVLRAGYVCYFAAGPHNFLRHMSLYEQASFTVEGLKKVG